MTDISITSLVRLIERSPDKGDGWRTVSSLLMREYVKPFRDQSLIEWTEEEDGKGRVRLSEKGITVAPYLGEQP